MPKARRRARRIVTTALRVFARRASTRPRTRQIAADAGVNPPALTVFFGGKEVLHRPCAQYHHRSGDGMVAPAAERGAARSSATRSARRP